MCGRVETEAGPQWPEAAHPRWCVTGGADGGGRLFGRFDHGDDDRVGTRVEHAPNRRGVRGGQAHRGRDGDVLEAAKQQGDVGVVEIAVLDVEPDVVVPGRRVLLRADDGGTDHPTTEDPFLGGECFLQSAEGHETIAILMRSGTGLAASSNAAWTSSTPKVWVT